MILFNSLKMAVIQDNLRDYLNTLCNKYYKKLKLVHLNAQSLNDSSHYSEFCYLFENKLIDVIVVSETFFKDNSKMDLSGYNVFFINRVESRGGGVAVYTREEISSKLICKSSGESLRPEYVMVEITLNSEKILLMATYRPPKVGYMENVENELFKYMSEYKYTILCGDLNARFGSGSTETKILENMLQACNLEPLPFQATYHTRDCDSILDVIATNCNEIVLHYDQWPASGFSNHDLIACVLDLQKPKQKQQHITFRDMKNFDYDKFKNDVKEVNWSELYAERDIDEKLFSFNNTVMHLINKHAPLKKIKIKNKNEPWMDGNIHELIHKRDEARKKWLKGKKEEDHEIFRIARNRTKQAIRNSKIKYFHKLFDSSKNIKDTWKAIKSLGAKKSKQKNFTTNINANDLNKYYIDVGKPRNEEPAKNATENYLSQEKPNYETFHFRYILPHEIKNSINSITSSAIGPDHIPIKFIKIAIDQFIPVLEHLFNFCLQSSVYPIVWKMANITPIAKIESPEECKDFRPVSILSCLGKTLEKLVHQQIIKYLEDNKILSPMQSGFREQCSTTTALIKVVDDIRKAIDRRHLTLAALLDLSKAFDCVNHNLLAAKLSSIGFSESVLKWFENYLGNRFQRVSLNDTDLSDWELILHGVPQGSALGPLLFSLYINDITTEICHCKAHLYADDIQLYIHFNIEEINQAVNLVNTDISNVAKYLSNHCLYVNPGKTQPIIIGSNKFIASICLQTSPKVIVNNQTVDYVTSVKNLGMMIDNTLSWKEQVYSTVKKVFASLAQIRRNIDVMPENIREKIVQSLILPILEYGLCVMTDISKENMSLLQKAQNSAVRFIFKARRDLHITPYYIKLGWLKMADRQTLFIANLTWKVIKFKNPSYLYEMFTFNTDEDIRCTSRSNKYLRIPNHRTVTYTNSFCITATRIFNHYQINNFIHYSTNIGVKKKIKSLLTQKYAEQVQDCHQ